MDTEAQEKKRMSATDLLKFAAALVPLLVGSLFFAGSLYWWSYCSYWGISGDAFPRSFQDTVSYGVIAFMLSTAKVIEPLLWLAIILAFLSLVLTCLGRFFSPDPKDPNQFKRLKQFGKWIDGRIPENKRPSLEQIRKDNAPAAFFLVASFGLILILLFLSIFYLTFYVRGGKIAENQHEKLMVVGDDGSLPWLIDVKFTPDMDIDDTLRRQLIFCFPDDCVFLLETGVEVVSRTNIVSMKASMITGLPE